MSTIQYQDGTKIKFEGDPTPQEVEEAYNNVKGTAQAPMDTLTDLVGQAGKSAYNAPILHKLLMQPLNQLSQGQGGASAEETYNAIPQPTTLPEQLASAGGSIAGTLPIAGPMVETAGSLLAGIPLVGGAIGAGAAGLGAYGALGAGVEGGNIGQGALEGATQGAVWGGLGKIGAMAGKKFLPSMPEGLEKALPPIVKAFGTPEGIGAVAGGLLAGNITAPEDQKLAGTLVGGALSMYAPASPEKQSFMESMGRTLGFNNLKKWMGVFSKGHQVATDVFKKFGFDQVSNTGNIVDPRTQENSVHQAAKNLVQASEETYTDLHNRTNPVLTNIDQKIGGNEEAGNLVKDIVNRVETKFKNAGMDNQVKKVMYDLLPSLQLIDIPGDIARQYGIAPEDFKGDIFKAPVQDITLIKDRKIATQIMSMASNKETILNKEYNPYDYKKAGNLIPNKVSYRALDDFRQALSKIASKSDLYESSTAAEIKDMISKHIKGKSEEYGNLMDDWHNYFKFTEKVGEADNYRALAEKLSKNYFNSDDTTRINKTRTLEEIDNYLKSVGQGQRAIKDTLDQYHAWQLFARPQVLGMSKTLPLRMGTSFVLANMLSTVGLGPVGSLAGTIGGWHMGSPEAWLPVLKGAGTRGLPAKSFTANPRFDAKKILANLLTTSQRMSKATKK